MSNLFSRRSLIGTAIAVAAGGVVGGSAASAAPHSATAKASAADLRVGTVTAHDGADVVVAVTQSMGTQSTVTMPAVGFPEGWRLRPGDRVGLRKGMKGERALSLVRWCDPYAGYSRVTPRPVRSSGSPTPADYSPSTAASGSPMGT